MMECMENEKDLILSSIIGVINVLLIEEFFFIIIK